MWPAPQRAGHITQLITTNECERTPAKADENAIATSHPRFAVNGGTVRVEMRTSGMADTSEKHDRHRKVTAILSRTAKAAETGGHAKARLGQTGRITTDLAYW